MSKTITRVLSVLLCAVLLFGAALPVGVGGLLSSLFSVEAQAATGTCGVNTVWSYDSGTLTISGEGSMFNYDGSRPPWYDSYRTSIKTLVIADGVTSIGKYAFKNCTSLANVTIGKGVGYIGKEAFAETAFYNNAVNWLNHMLYAGNCLIKVEKSFSGSCELKAGTQCIAEYAFDGCSQLTSVKMPETVMRIGDGAFNNCSKLASITIPDSVTRIGGGVFVNCSEDLIIYGYADTYAETYAGERGITFVPLDTTIYTIEYDPNGGLGTLKKQSKIHGRSITLNTDVPWREGYDFLYWSTEANGSGSTYEPGDVYKANANAILYAQWIDNSTPYYIVSYNATGGEGAPAKQTKRDGETLRLSSTIPTREGHYVFLNWNTKPDGSGTSYAPGAYYYYNTDCKLYAMWQNGDYIIRSVTLGDATVKYKFTTKLDPVVGADADARRDLFKYTYTPKDKTIVSVDEKGVVTGLKRGSTTVKVTVTDVFGNTVSDECTVTVKYSLLQWIVIIFFFGWRWYI